MEWPEELQEDIAWMCMWLLHGELWAPTQQWTLLLATGMHPVGH